MSTRNSSRFTPIIIAISVVAGILIGTFYAKHFAGNRLGIINGSSNKLNALLRIVDDQYVDTVNMTDLVEKAMPQILAELDPHSTYIPAQNLEEVNSELEGSFSGIGIQFTIQNDTIHVNAVIQGGPSEKVGLMAGDRIVNVDDSLFVGKKLNNELAMRTLKGPKGSQVKLGVKRVGEPKLLDFTITRGDIPQNTVDAAYMLNDDIGYVKVSKFGRTSHVELLNALAQLNHKKCKGLIIDLRGNTGGYMEAAIRMVNEFLPEGKLIVYTQGRKYPRAEEFANGTGSCQKMPLVVLIDEGSASASEIFTGAIQDNDRGTVVGRRSFGKGLVQVPRSLPYGGTMKVTTSKYYIPSGRCVQAIDYKHRNEDGSVGTIPDSLTKVFHTAAGREVRDGGGVMPDIVIKQEKLPNILFYLVRDNLIFDYATQYCLKHPTIVAPEKFEVTDADYNDFKALVKKADFKYDQQSEKILKTLKEAAEFEGYMDDASEEFKALEKKLNHDLDRDLDYFSSDIKKMIATEIIKRYYYQRGNIIQQLKDDDGLKEAMKILNDPVKYKEMLSAPTAKK